MLLPAGSEQYHIKQLYGQNNHSKKRHNHGIRVEGFSVLDNCSSFALNAPVSLSAVNADGNQFVRMLKSFTGGTYEVESKAGTCQILLSSSSFSAIVKRCV